MALSPYVTNELKLQLQREVPHLAGEIRSLYQRLDRQLGLNGAKVPVSFGFETDVLGSYTPGEEGKKEHFHYSLLFIGYLDSRQIPKHDKIDLYKHEYAHYMVSHLEIPKEHQWQPGKHGSAWKYCCSLIGANPTAYFEKGKGLVRSDYGKALENPWKNPNYSVVDTMRREKEYQQSRDRIVRFREGDMVEHPRFGSGTVEKAEQLAGSVRLRIRFADGVHVIDQKWLVQHTDERFRTVSLSHAPSGAS